MQGECFTIGLCLETGSPKHTKQMSDFYLNAYESGLDAQEQEAQERAAQAADAGMEAICNMLDIRGKDWEQLHSLLSGHLVDFEAA